jgi:hypothetical protein
MSHLADMIITFAVNMKPPKFEKSEQRWIRAETGHATLIDVNGMLRINSESRPTSL